MTTLWELVQSWAESAAARSAVVANGQRLTYGELAARARNLTMPQLAGAPVRLLHVATDPAEVAVAVVAAQRTSTTLLVADPNASPVERERSCRVFGVEGVLSGGEVREFGSVSADRGRPDGPPGLGLSTSGVEGQPKCIQRPWDTVSTNAEAFAAAVDVSRGCVLLCTTPPHHSYALCAGLLTALAAGGTYVSLSGRPSPRTLADVLASERVDVLMSVPLLYRWYSTAGLRGARAPRLCLSAGAPLLPQDRAAWEANVGWPIGEHYGTSEFGMLTVDLAGVAGSVGRPIGGIEIRVDAPDPEGVGEVAVRTSGAPTLLLRPSAPAVELSGWVGTGDLGRLDNGALRLCGRIGSVYNLAGNKVSAAEVEAAIRGYGPVVECAVIGDPAGADVTRLCAFVEAKSGFDRLDLVAHLRSHVAPYKIPAVVVVVDRLPRSASGKLLRSQLQPPAGV